VVATGETDKGVWVFIHDTGETEFIPHSQITDNSEIEHEGDEGRLCVTEWLAEKRGWLKTSTPWKSQKGR
jgi:hypothetical protein